MKNWPWPDNDPTAPIAVMAILAVVVIGSLLWRFLGGY